MLRKLALTSLYRLHELLNIIAKYGLDDFLENLPNTVVIKIALTPYRAKWAFSKTRKGDLGKRTRIALEELGPIYIKLGQLFSTRPDFIDPIIANELKLLQDSVTPFFTPSVHDLLLEHLGSSPADIFSDIEEKPLASASIAQVYAATLRTGDKVVIKIIKPGIISIIKTDLGVLKKIASIIESRTKFGRRLKLGEVLSDYEKVILNETNLQLEAANTTKLESNFSGSSNLYVPKIYWDYTRQNVLVMEKIDGIPVTNIDELQSHGINLKTLSEIGVDIFFTQVFEHNFFHADMHPGNIFVSKEHPKDPQYIAIDCAIIGSLEIKEKNYLAKNLLAIFNRDYHKVARLHIESGWVPEGTKTHEFETAIRSVCEPIFQKPLKEISFGQLLVSLFQTSSAFDMQVQPSLVLLQKTLLHVEGLGRQLYPDLDLWETAKPHLERWNTRQLSPFTFVKKMKESFPDLVNEVPNLPAYLSAFSSLNEIVVLKRKELFIQEQALEREKRNRRRGFLWIGVLFLALGLGVTPLLESGIYESDHARVILSSAFIGLGGCFLYFSR